MILAPKKYILGVAFFRLNCSLDSVSLKKRYFKLSRDIYICIVFSNMILPVRCAFTNQNLCDELPIGEREMTRRTPHKSHSTLVY